MPRCQECGKVRTTEPDYNPIRLINGSTDPGWYSSPDDGELCGPCMVAIFKKANGR